MKDGHPRSGSESPDKPRHELLSQLCDHAQDIMAAVEDSGRILWVNAAVRTVLGYEPDDLANHNLAEWVHPDDGALVAEEIRKTLDGTSERQTLDVRCRHHDGSWRTLEVAANPLPSQPRPSLAVTARDISHRRTSEDLQQAVDRMAEATRDARTPAELFAAAHRILRDLVPAENFFVALQDPETGWLSFPYWVDRRDPGPTSHPPGRGMTEFVIQNNRSLHLTPETLPTFLAGSGADLLGSCPLEWIGCPLRSTDRVLGVLVLQSYEPATTLGLHALKVLEVLATPLTLALNSLAQEEARRDSEQSYQLLFSEMHAAFWVVELENSAPGAAAHAHIVECNAALERLLLRPRAQLVGRRLADVLAPENPPWLEQLTEINRTGAPMVQQDWPSSHLQRHMTVHGYRISAGRVACLAEDISERKRSEQALQRRDALLEALAFTAERFLRTADWEDCVQDVLATLGEAAEVSRVYIFQVDCTPESRLEANQRYEWVAEGISPQIDNPRLQHLDILNPEWKNWLSDLKEGRVVAGHVSQFSDHEQKLFEDQQVKSVMLVPVFAGGFLWGIIGCDECRAPRAWMASEKDAFRSAAQTLGEAVQRRHAEESMRVRSAALASAANGIVITDHAGHIIFVNQAFQKLTGYSAGEVLGHTPSILKSGQHDTAFYHQMWLHMNEGRVWRGEITNRRKDGTLYQEEMTITPVRNPAGKVTHFIAIKQDISERRNLQQQLQQAQKMESIGRLAGGIAHDFNNLLQAITGFSSILMTDLGDGDPRRSDVEEIDRAAQRAVALTRQLLAFSRKQKMELVPVELNQVVQGTEKMLRRLIGENVVLDDELAPNLPTLLADPGQLEQVVVNLAVNARDAMPEGGRLIIRTCAVELAAGALPDMAEARPGTFVKLSVEDNGTGMIPAVRERLFEPFFSTKGPGKGTGLGLAVVYGIVRQHGGFIDVETAPAVGTRMDIYLPAGGVQPGQTAPAPAAPPLGHKASGRSERILILEDENSVRELAARVLREQHYQVDTAATCAEARNLIQSAVVPYDLLLSDVVLPDGNGIRLADELTNDRPTLPVLLCSAYSDEQARSQAIRERGYHFLAKPYPMAALLREVRLLLDRIPSP